MASSTQYLNMINQGNLFAFYDFKPWGGVVSNTSIPIPDARVVSVRLGAGTGFDTASIVLSVNNFGDTTSYFLPIKIAYIEPIGGTQTIIFRGFVTSDTQTLSSSTNGVSMQLVGYRWYLSRSTQMRGRWYRHLNASTSLTGSTGGSGPAAGTGVSTGNPPLQLGSAISTGSQKFIYEKFRGAITDASGYLQNEDMVFNRDGFPDCYIDNTVGSAFPVFYIDNIGYPERGGLPLNFHERKMVDGYYWTYATILRHIEKYWMEPYNATFAGIDINSADLSNIAAIPEEESRPLNFSLQGFVYA